MKLLRLPTALLVTCLACASPEPAPDYGRPLPPGSPALLPVGPDEALPDFSADWRDRDKLLPAVERSIDWMHRPSSATHFPIEGVSHAKALASLERFAELLGTARSAEEFAEAVARDFRVYKSAGWDGRGGGVLFTGYCTPILDGSRERGGPYQYPLFGLPADLVKDEHGNILGQRTASGLRPYPDRRTIESSGMLENQGLELAWLTSPLDAYIAHVNGSAVIREADGRLFRLGYAGKNGRPYTSLRNELVKDGRLEEISANLTTIRTWADENPDEVSRFTERNESYVFFTPITGSPRGSLNVEVTRDRSLATDKSLFPRGAVVYVDTVLGGGSRSSQRRFSRFMLDQDTGGAIRTAGRADIYLGIGTVAERLAGTTKAEGQLYYLFLRG